MSDYAALIKIVFPATEPWYSAGEARKVGGVISFMLDGLQIDEQITIMDNDKRFLSFSLMAGFELFKMYRGDWWVEDIGTDNACEFHKGSTFIINRSGALTPETYEVLVRDELSKVKEYFEDE